MTAATPATELLSLSADRNSVCSNVDIGLLASRPKMPTTLATPLHKTGVAMYVML